MLLKTLKEKYRFVLKISIKKRALLIAFLTGASLAVFAWLIDRYIHQGVLDLFNDSSKYLLGDISYIRATLGLALLFLLVFGIYKKVNQYRGLINFLVFSPLTVASLALMTASGILAAASLIELNNFMPYMSVAFIAAVMSCSIRFVLSNTPYFKREIHKAIARI